MPQPTLPPELIGAILQNVRSGLMTHLDHTLWRLESQERVEEQEEVRTLARCCLVSSTFLPFAQEGLYGRVSLESLRDTGYALGPKPRKLLDTLTSNPALASLVRHVVIYADRNVDPKEVQEATERALKTCTEVVDLSIELVREGWGGGWIEKAVMRYNRNLVALSVGGDYEWKPMELLAMLKRFPALRTLELELPEELMSLPAPSFLQLKSFSVLSHGVDVALLDHFLGGSRSSLVSLGLGAGFSPRQSFDFSRYTSLKIIEIELEFISLDDDEGQLLFSSIGTAPSVQVLALEPDDSSPSYYLPSLRHIESTRLLHLLPPSLRRIRAHFLSLSTAYLLSVLNDTTCLPALESIGLYRGTIQGDDGRAAQRPLEELEMLEKAAEARGVQLVWSKEPMSAYR